MAYDVKSFRAWATYYDVAQELSERDQGLFYRALFEYMFAGNDLEDKLPKTARICFKSIKANLKRSKSQAMRADTCADGEELARSTSHQSETKNALNLNLNLNSNLRGDGAASDEDTAAPSQGLPQTVSMPCPECGKETDAALNDAMGQYSVQCRCGFDAMLTPGAVALAIERGES